MNWKFWQRWQKRPRGRSDGWENLVTGLGTVRDKRTASAFYSCAVDDATARDMWRAEPIAARVIELIPKEMFRQGFSVAVKDEGAGREVSEAIDEYLKRLDALRVFRLAKSMERAYGGAAILPATNDLQSSLASPLRPDQSVSVKALQVFEPRELQAERYYTDPRNPKFRKPELYRLNPINPGGLATASNVLIHESRLIIFPGIRVSAEQPTGTFQGWGDSILTRVATTLRDFGSSMDSVAHLVQDASQAVYKIQGLAAAMAGDDEDIIKTRMEQLELCRSVLRGFMLDAEHEDFERKGTTFTDIPAVIDRLANFLAAATDIPVTILMGQAPAGLNATGDADTRFFYDRVSAAQDDLTPLIEQLVRLIFLSADGPTRGKEPKKWSVEWTPLWQPSEKEVVETRAMQSEIDERYFNMGALSATEIRQSRFGGDAYSLETTIDPELDEMVKEEAETDLTTPVPGTPPAGGTGETATPSPGSPVPSKPAGGPSPEKP